MSAEQAALITACCFCAAIWSCVGMSATFACLRRLKKLLGEDAERDGKEKP